ncbi:MAG: DNA (cytosine-5-)-methyltransferase [Nitrospira sp.]|nr:DNA (cytosine-5-)-methyltransferase [Nitrospira sp.]
MKENLHPTFLDLFAGAGGFSLGFERAGFRCIGAVENDLQAGKSYCQNFPRDPDGPLFQFGPVHGDVGKLDKAFLESGLIKNGVKDLDLLLGGPPCQGFSRVGRGKLDHLANVDGAFKVDPRNKLYLKFLDVLEWSKPKAFLFENVPGILHLGGKNEAESVCEIATSLGYRVCCTVLNAAWYGVPQSRERVFILGLRIDKEVAPTFPKPIYRVNLTRGHLTALQLSKNLFRNPVFFHQIENPQKGKWTVTVHQALGDLPLFFRHLKNRNYKAIRKIDKGVPYRIGRPNSYAHLMRNWGGNFISDKVRDHYSRHTPRDYETFARMKPGEKYADAVRIAEARFRMAKQKYLNGKRKSFPKREKFVPPYQTETFDEKWRKLIPDEPSWTVTAHLARDCYSHIHYDSSQKRAITIREAARLQSFPDAFEFCGNMGDCFRQIGNAVPPLLAFHLAKHIRKVLKSSIH